MWSKQACEVAASGKEGKSTQCPHFLQNHQALPSRACLLNQLPTGVSPYLLTASILMKEEYMSVTKPITKIQGIFLGPGPRHGNHSRVCPVVKEHMVAHGPGVSQRPGFAI